MEGKHFEQISIVPISSSDSFSGSVGFLKRKSKGLFVKNVHLETGKAKIDLTHASLPLNFSD